MQATGRLVSAPATVLTIYIDPLAELIEGESLHIYGQRQCGDVPVGPAGNVVGKSGLTVAGAANAEIDQISLQMPRCLGNITEVRAFAIEAVSDARAVAR